MVSSLLFILSEGLAPVPTKLVAMIHRDEFVDMADLLRDNLEVRRQGDLLEATSSTMEPKRNRREVLDLLSWVQCFGTYIAIVTSHQLGGGAFLTGGGGGGGGNQCCLAG